MRIDQSAELVTTGGISDAEMFCAGRIPEVGVTVDYAGHHELAFQVYDGCTRGGTVALLADTCDHFVCHTYLFRPRLARVDRIDQSICINGGIDSNRCRAEY